MAEAGEEIEVVEQAVAEEETVAEAEIVQTPEPIIKVCSIKLEEVELANVVEIEVYLNLKSWDCEMNALFSDLQLCIAIFETCFFNVLA